MVSTNCWLICSGFGVYKYDTILNAWVTFIKIGSGSGWSLKWQQTYYVSPNECWLLNTRTPIKCSRRPTRQCGRRMFSCVIKLKPSSTLSLCCTNCRVTWRRCIILWYIKMHRLLPVHSLKSKISKWRHKSESIHASITMGLIWICRLTSTVPLFLAHTIKT